MKIIKKVVCLVFALMLFLLCVPNFSCVALASDEQKFSLVPYNYNTNRTKYEITEDNIRTFTPFDVENKARMAGMSFTLKSDEFKQIKSQSVKTERVENLDKNVDYSLYTWIYFDGTNIHDFLTISLILENDASIVWQLTYRDIIQLCEDKDQSFIEGMPIGWLNLELPLSIAIKSDIDDGSSIYPVVRLEVSYTSLQTNDNATYASIKFYDIYMAQSKNRDRTLLDKQNYRISEFVSFAEKDTKNLIVGDIITTPSVSQAVVYAFDGETNLLTSKDAKWKVEVREPDSMKYLSYDLEKGRQITLGKEGVYEIWYRCYLSSALPVVSYLQTLNVGNANLVYFKQNSKRVEVGKTYEIEFQISSLLESVDSIVISSSSENLNYTIKENAIEITAQKDGEYSLKIEVSGKRENRNVATFNDEITITAYKRSSGSKVLKIVIWVSLGVFVLVLIAVVIKILVKNKKIDVK